MEEKQISLVILGIIAVIAILGLVFMFKTSAATTGEAIAPDAVIPPETGRPYYTASLYQMDDHAIPITPEVHLKGGRP